MCTKQRKSCYNKCDCLLLSLRTICDEDEIQQQQKSKYISKIKNDDDDDGRSDN